MAPRKPILKISTSSRSEEPEEFPHITKELAKALTAFPRLSDLEDLPPLFAPLKTGKLIDDALRETYETTPLSEQLAEAFEAHRKKLIAELGKTKPKGGRKKKADPDQVRAFVAASTRPGQNPNAFTKRRACAEFDINDRTLRRYLKGGQN